MRVSARAVLRMLIFGSTARPSRYSYFFRFRSGACVSADPPRLRACLGDALPVRKTFDAVFATRFEVFSFFAIRYISLLDVAAETRQRLVVDPQARKFAGVVSGSAGTLNRPRRSRRYLVSMVAAAASHAPPWLRWRTLSRSSAAGKDSKVSPGEAEWPEGFHSAVGTKTRCRPLCAFPKKAATIAAVKPITR